MATRRTPGSRPGLIRCDHCGEEYSASYRRCPFCDEYDEYDAYEDSAPRSSRSGGKRLAKSNRRGGGYGRTSPLRVIGYLISLAVIVAAVYIVVTVISPLIQRGNVPDDVIDTEPSQSTPAQDADPDSTGTPDITGEPDSTDEPADIDTEPTAEPSPSASSTANGFTLSKKEFSFTADYPDPVTLTVTFVPSGTSGTVTWSSSNTDYVTVDQNGKVSRGAQRGTATVTATLDNGVTQSCTVHNQVSGGTSSGGETTTPSTSSARLSKTDFTFYTAGEKTTLTVRDYSGSITWSSSNTSVATVSADGVCKAVGNGRCTITATLSDGTKLEAIARCSLS